MNNKKYHNETCRDCIENVKQILNDYLTIINITNFTI